MAESLRVQTAASNIAHASDRGPLPEKGAEMSGENELFKPLEVVQSPVITGGVPGGVQATTTQIAPSYIPVYEPDSEFANEDGMVAAPNVDIARNMTTLVEAKAAYKANLMVIETVDDMYDALFDVMSDRDDEDDRRYR
ncbi:MAG: flagellar basal body rod C-terminal domain-containing protein [Filomicrobium sp.]